jgi:TPR repeat protein
VQPHYELQRGKIAHTKKDFKSAVCWFYLAATAGESEAQGLLGAYFREGFHVEKNPSLAFYWTERSAEAGNASGAITLAALYEEGVGTPVNSSKAQFWRERSKLLQAQDNKEALAEQHAQTLQDQQLEALTRLAIVGAIVATDPGLPVPCKILARRDSTPSQIDNAKAEIANHNLKCN